MKTYTEQQMIEFATKHVRAALKAASQQAKGQVSFDEVEIDEHSILNAYPDVNINIKNFIIFNPYKKDDDKLTADECLMPMLEITDKQNAIEYKRDYYNYIERIVRKISNFNNEKLKKEATRFTNDNIGYYFGYYSMENRIRIEELFECVHPILGSAIAMKDNPPSRKELSYCIDNGITLESFRSLGNKE